MNSIRLLSCTLSNLYSGIWEAAPWDCYFEAYLKAFSQSFKNPFGYLYLSTSMDLIVLHIDFSICSSLSSQGISLIITLYDMLMNIMFNILIWAYLLLLNYTGTIWWNFHPSWVDIVMIKMSRLMLGLLNAAYLSIRGFSISSITRYSNMHNRYLFVSLPL